MEVETAKYTFTSKQATAEASALLDDNCNPHTSQYPTILLYIIYLFDHTL